MFLLSLCKAFNCLSNFVFHKDAASYFRCNVRPHPSLFLALMMEPRMSSKLFFLSSSVQVHPFDVTTPRDSYAWNYREPMTLLALSESLVESGLEPVTMESIRTNIIH